MNDQAMSYLVAAAVAETMKPENIEPKIAKAVEAMVDDVVKSSLRAYSDNGRLIEDAVKKSLAIGSLDLPSYGSTVCTILQDQIQAKVAPLVAGQLATDMDSMLNLAPKELKLSTIARDMLKSHWNYDMQFDEQLVTCIVELPSNPTGLTFIYLDDDEAYSDDEKYKCQINFHVDADGYIKGGSTTDRISSHRQTKLENSKDFGTRNTLSQKVRSWWACGTKIIVDYDDIETSRTSYD